MYYHEIYQGYQFWVEADVDSGFQIRNVLPGTYNLYAWIPGYLGEYVSANTISVESGNRMSENLLLLFMCDINV